MSTRSQTNHRRLARLPSLRSKTLHLWIHSLNISDVSTLQQVSATWNEELVSANYPYYNSIDIHSSNFAHPLLFDDAALLRVLKMSGTYLKSLRLSGLHSLVLERRSPVALYLKENGSKIVLISITNCKNQCGQKYSGVRRKEICKISLPRREDPWANEGMHVQMCHIIWNGWKINIKWWK